MNFPQARDIEKAVLGAMMFEEEAIEMAMELITETAFYSPVHKIVFEAIVTLFNQGGSVDQLTLSEYLSSQGTLNKIGGEPFIASLVGELTAAANIKSHCQILISKQFNRDVMTNAQALITLCEDESEDSRYATEQHVSTLMNLMDKTSARPYVTMSELMPRVYQSILEDMNRTGTAGISTGIGLLDKKLDGLQPGLYVIGALTSQGKTALALNLALHCSSNNIPAGIFSLEMGELALGKRLVTMESRYNVKNIRFDTHANDKIGDILNSTDKISRYPVLINDTPGISVVQIIANSRRMQKNHDIKLVVVDYLQLAEGDKSENRQLEITGISRSLKQLAMTMKIPIIALSQFNRKAEEGEGRTPRLADIRESGAISQDADVVMFIHNPLDSEKKKHYPEMDESERVMIREFIIAKNREGETGSIHVVWNPSHLRFYDLDLTRYAPPPTTSRRKDYNDTGND